MSREKKQQLFRFPMKGIHVVGMKNEQPEGTCYDALNVRPYDTIEGRARGGSRPGLTKYCSNTAGAFRVQDLNYVTAISTSLVATSLSRRTITPVMVADGVIKTFSATTVTNASATGNAVLGNAAQSPFAFSTELFQRLYYADGRAYKIFVAANTSAIDWTPSAGTLPGDQGNNITCRLIETWRGRIVLSGLASDPHNWFMSKLGDPLDWDYAPATETELDAVQGGAGFVGKCPDIINCIIPYNDDVLLFGCDHSIWMMSGDPQAGGRMDLVTNTVGMAFGRPYTQLPDGSLMFFSNGGSVYRMAPGQGKPESISRDSIDPLISNTNLNTHLVRMVYDEGDHAVYTFIKPLAANTNTTHYYYDLRNNGWFKFQLGDNSYDPVAMVVFDGDAPGDRVILLGGQDGFVRKFDKTVYQDDGTNFTSYVTMGPIVADAGRYPCILSDLQFVMDNASGTTIFELGVGDTAEKALADFAATFTGEITMNNATISIPAGRGYNIQPRTRGFFQYFKVGTTSPTAAWAIEHIQASYSVIRTSRGRVSAIEANYFYRRPDGPPLLNTQGLYGAWWMDYEYYTLAGANLNTWLLYQGGTGGGSPPTFLPSGNVVINTTDTNFNGKASALFTGSGGSIQGTIPAGATNMDVGNGLVMMAIMPASDTIDSFWRFARPSAAEAWFCVANSISKKFSVGDAIGAGNTQTANTAFTPNTMFILTFGSNTPNGPWEIWYNNTQVLDANLGQFWGDIDNGNGALLTIGTAGTGKTFRLGAMAIYTAYNSTVRAAALCTMATFYGITY